MHKFFSLIIILYLLPQLSFSQNISIKGTLADSTNNDKPSNAVITLLRQMDSTLVTYTRSDKNGNFQISGLDPGKYIVLVTYPKYGDYVEKIDLSSAKTFDFKTIYLTQKAKLLQAIFIRQQAIRIKGDTTEFAADSFHVKPNANVEDLLKELPGIQVDKDGKITAQGQQVQKILVDGDEFFSDDPTVATRNLRADAVDKVQVFDKKSDQAEFTGIDDGEKTKTINLKLKENAKHGYFGKLSAGGLDKYYNAQAMINAFKAKRKISAFAITSSTDQTGLNFNDSRNYGFDNTSIEFGDGTITINKDDNSDLGVGNTYGQGLPESVKAGAHFSNKWDNDKYNVNGNYVFNKVSTYNRGSSYIQNILADSVYYNSDAAETHSDKMRHSASGILEVQLDSSSSIKVNAFGSTGNNTNSTTDNSQALSQQFQTVNSSIRRSSSKGNNNNFNSTVLWRKKFKKKGRTISVSFNEKYTDSDSKGFLNNRSDFYNNDGIHFRTDTTDQSKINNASQNSIGAKATYTEPISKSSYLEINYSFFNNSSNQTIESYNKDFGGKYTQLVDSLSNDFRYIYNTHTAGINYRYNGKKIIASLGGDIANTAFQQTNLVIDTTRSYHYYNFFPRGSFRYKFSSFSNLSIQYNGSTTQPSIDQIQPLKNNDDPLNVVVGNPELKQQFTNNINLTFNNFQILNQRYIFAGGFASFIKNQISNSYTIDSLGRTVNKYVNVDGNYSVNFYVGIGMKIPKTQIRLNIQPNINFSNYGNFVNGLRNNTQSTRVSSRFQFNTNKKNVFEIFASFTPSYSVSKSSISKVAGTKYWTFDYSLDGSYQLPWKLEIGSDIDFNLRQKTNAFDKNNNVILWNAYLEKKFLKNDVLTLRAGINDILDQNKGYNRNINPNSIVETNYLTLRRYGMITLTYNFNNKGGSQPKSGFNF